MNAEDTNNRGLRIWEWLVISTMIGGLAILLLPGIRATDIGPHDVPRTPPDESRRIYHPNGFSFIQPPNWDSAIQVDPDGNGGTLRLFPYSNRLRRISAGFFVLRGVGEPQPARESTVFQGQPAIEEPMHIQRQDTFDDPGRSDYSVTFERDGVWYSIVYLIGEERTELPPMVRQYIESFRTEDYCNSPKTIRD